MITFALAFPTIEAKLSSLCYFTRFTDLKALIKS